MNTFSKNNDDDSGSRTVTSVNDSAIEQKIVELKDVEEETEHKGEVQIDMKELSSSKYRATENGTGLKQSHKGYVVIFWF